ncbi:preprotein translocase subunit SecA [Sphingobacteriales bacterium UPWRP_1]|nr:preprotein translocase subunit SecA [Sphingobacteriales bacterium TSM_CSS]PSJ74701.1 preprotein translocase subunit SecA [Sphingobacteriales bacterium UPWRP_1]
MSGFFGKILESIFGSKYEKDVKSIKPLVALTNEEFSKLASLSNDELRAKTPEFKAHIAAYLEETDAEIASLEEAANNDPDMDAGEKEDLYSQIDKMKKARDRQLEEVLTQILPQAFAVVKETARRFSQNETLTATATQLDRDLSVTADYLTIEDDKAIYKNEWTAAGGHIKWNMVHFDVQLIGGIVLHQGKIAEMATGEGKTLVATLPAYLNALAGQGVHIVTVNDYLAKRDSEWNQPIFNFLGITVDCIDKHRPNTRERRKAYNADITYGTNNEFGFDYLRDNMVRSPEELVQRKLHFAMVDEVDSVLIDDARTPLIISGPVERGDEQEYETLKPRIERLVNAQRELTRKLLVNAKDLIEKGKTDEKAGGLALLRAHRGLPKNKPLIKFLSEPGMKNILLTTENFYLQEQAKRMPEVDQELYFVIEEKNNQVTLTEKGVELITNTGEEADLFIIPDIGAKIAEIEASDKTTEQKQKAKDLLLQEFAVKSDRLHSVHQLLKAYTLFEKDVEYIVLEGKVKIVDEQTGRIMEGRRYSDGLHQAIEAKESVKVEDATQTYATVTLQNFFRMYHKLAGMTGTAETEAGEFWEIYKLDVVVIPTNKPIARKDEEDLVYRTAREKFNAVIDEIVRLREAGRPVLVGTTSVEVSELLSRMLQMRKIPHNVLNAKQHAREAEIVAQAGIAGAVTIATNMAGRGTDIKLGPGVKDAGGLAIIGTERHDSRRVDRQLRGRSGRQGDPGTTQFYVSLEDNLMRLFGSDRIASIMDRVGYKEGEVIQHSMITKSIERAQKKVEENNFGIRKRLLDYDEVMNVQRNAIYGKRRHALFGERLSLDIANSFADLCDETVAQYHESHDYQNFKYNVRRTFAVDTNISETEFNTLKTELLSDMLYQEVTHAYKRKTTAIADEAYPVLSNLYHQRGEQVERVYVPFSDGSKQLNVIVPLKQAVDSKGKLLVTEFEKSVSLGFIDEAWMTHLRQMDDLKNSVQTAVYEQKDPLLIFKQEAYGLFRDMVSEVNIKITDFLFQATIPVEKSEDVREARTTRTTDTSKLKTSRTDTGASGIANNQAPPAPQQQTNAEPQKPQTFKRTLPKIGPNDPCPCGSGLKYKKCHGKPGSEKIF